MPTYRKGKKRFFYIHIPRTAGRFIYENIIRNPHREIKSLLKACDLDWNDNCLKFYENKRIVKTASDSQVRKKIYKTSLDSWKNYKKFMKSFFSNLPN